MPVALFEPSQLPEGLIRRELKASSIAFLLDSVSDVDALLPKIEE